MWNRNPIRSGLQALLFVVIFLLTIGHRPAEAGDPLYSLDEIAARLKEWEAKIKSLRVHTRIVCDPNSRQAVKAGLVGVPRIEYDDCIWTSQGHFRTHHWVTLDGHPSLRTLRAVDTERSWQATYANGRDESDPTNVSLSTRPDWHDRSWPTPLEGLHGRRIGDTTLGWLGGAIESGELEFVGVEELDGRQCIRMCLSLARDPSTDPRDFWLDPEHGFLPVQIEALPDAKYTVEKFFELEPGFYFPRRGVFRAWSGEALYRAEEWEVTAVELNQAVPAALWEPPIVKANIPDLAKKASERGRRSRYWIGNYAERMLELDFWIEGGFLAILLIAFVVVLVLIIRKRRSGVPRTSS